MSTLRSIVLCGGSGTRLWPLSRALYPKQFMDLGGHTLFGDTVDRAAALPDSADPLVVCNEEHRFYVAAALQQKGVSGTILLEPKGRNTAPAIALAAFAALSGGGDPLLLVLPSDHVLKPQDVFAEAVARARACAESGRIVTFGITPDAPETGFGYIRRGGALPSGGYAVARFVEKPDLARAEAMLADGGYLWNSGMFLFRASIYLEELALHAPGIHAACKAAWEGHHADRDFIRPDADAFLSSPADSIDYAVMEKTDRAAVVPLTADWSDLGSWEAFYEAAPHDGDGNVRVGDVYAEGAENCYLHASNRMVAALGVSDLVVVETADSVLVADRARTQDVKKIVESLKKEGRGEAENHPLVYRPWGSYETLARGERFQVKRIIVKPGGQLSLQKHHHRAEHWVVVEGTAEITVGDKVLLYHEDQSTYIPLKVNAAGVIPIIFASCLIYFPAQLAALFNVGWLTAVADAISTGWVNWILTVLLIVFFAYFYTSMVFNPDDTADNLKKQGGFIPGVRPGRATAAYIKNALNKITLPSAVFLALIAIVPSIIFSFTGNHLIQAFGGTSILIMVGVVLDTVDKLEGQIKMYDYDGFFK